jgi:hypothetical protein
MPAPKITAIDAFTKPLGGHYQLTICPPGLLFLWNPQARKSPVAGSIALVRIQQTLGVREDGSRRFLKVLRFLFSLSAFYLGSRILN